MAVASERSLFLFAGGMIPLAFAVACGGSSTRATDDSRSKPDGPSGSVRLVEGDVRVFDARWDGSRVAYVPRDTNELWMVAPGEAPELVFDFGVNIFSASFAPDSDVLFASASGSELVRWTPDGGTETLSESANLASNVTTGDAILYTERDYSDLVLWREGRAPFVFANSTHSDRGAVSERFAVSSSDSGVVAVDLSTDEVRILSPSRSPVLLGRDDSVAFATSDLVLHVVDVASGAELAEAPDVSLTLRLDREASTLFFRDNAGVIKRISMNGGPVSTAFTGVTTSDFLLSPDGTMIAFDPVGHCDYECSIAVEADGGEPLFGGVLPRGGSACFIDSSSVFAVTSGYYGACGRSISLVDLRGDSLEKSIGGTCIGRHEPMRDDEDGLLFVDPGPALLTQYSELTTLNVARASTGATAPIRGDIGSWFQISDRRLVADVHDAAPGIYVIPIPVL